MMEVRVPKRKPSMKGGSYNPHTHLINVGADRAICGLKPKYGWSDWVGKVSEIGSSILFLGRVNCLRCRKVMEKN